jgi:two-component system, NarL family, response regulator NreC
MAARLHLASSHSDSDASVDAHRSISVVLADDHPLMRRTLRRLEQVQRCQPQVLVLDLSMSDGACEDLHRVLQEHAANTQVVVLTTDDSPVRVQRALAAGAIGYVLKEHADSELPDAVRSAAQGEEYVSPRMGVRLEELYRSLTDERITPREVEVLRLIALGHTSVEIARKLQLSPRTIETHRAHIHQKLGLSTRAQLVRYALRRGLLRG